MTNGTATTGQACHLVSQTPMPSFTQEASRHGY
jgi:hypothetical protein